jgi:hypothetical protein
MAETCGEEEREIINELNCRWKYNVSMKSINATRCLNIILLNIRSNINLLHSKYWQDRLGTPCIRNTTAEEIGLLLIISTFLSIKPALIFLEGSSVVWLESDRVSSQYKASMG